MAQRRMNLRLMLVASLLGAAIATAAGAQAPAAAPTKTQIEEIVRGYILDNPEILLEAMQRLKERQQQAESSEGRRAVALRRSEIVDDADSPVAGNPKGDVTIVEFFDFRCPVCKRATPILADLVKGDGRIRWVYKLWPILGAESEYAARAALAARWQGKYQPFHDAMMAHEGALSEDEVMRFATKAGLDRGRLATDMMRPEIAEILKRNFALAEALRINGTPSYIIGENVVRGMRDGATLKALVVEARKKG